MNHSTFLAQRRFGSLDGLRAISILAVIWHHTAPAWAGPIWGRIGAQGVSLFFAISGFLITTLLLRERNRNGEFNLKDFYLRRILRIFPLYYGALLLYVLLVGAMQRNIPAGQAFFGNLIYFATYTSNIFVPLDGRVIFYFAWSLAAEEQFYLIWPPILYMTRSLPRALIALGIALATGTIAELFGIRVFSIVPLAIVAGVLLALILHSATGYKLLQSLLGQSWSSLVLAIILIPALVWAPIPAFVPHILFAAFVGACVIREKHFLAPLLSMKPVAYIGSISYGMYMLHMLCKNFIARVLAALHLPADGPALFVLTFVLAIVAASLSFKYYESYFLNLRARMAQPRRSRLAHARSDGGSTQD